MNEFEAIAYLLQRAGVAIAGGAALMLGTALGTGVAVEAFSLDWALARDLAASLSDAVVKGAGPLSSTPIIDSMRDGITVWMVAVAVPLAWYLFAWSRYGYDDRNGTVVPRYRPPEGLSPAGIRQISGMQFDEKVMAAEMLSLAIKGHVRFSLDEAGSYVLQKTDAPVADLSRAERHLLGLLFHGDPEVRLDGSHYQGTRLRAVMEAFGKWLGEEFEGRVYRTNIWAVLVGIVISGLGIVAAVTYRLEAMQITADIAMAVETFLFLVLINALFYRLMRAPTALGRELLDQIDGFRMYLGTSERERLKMSEAPEMSEHLYAAYLPYALAMDMELLWSERFSIMLKRMIPDPLDYFWYSGEYATDVDDGLLGMARKLGISIRDMREHG